MKYLFDFTGPAEPEPVAVVPQRNVESHVAVVLEYAG